jgi:hypothetical protein
MARASKFGIIANFFPIYSIRCEKKQILPDMAGFAQY